YTGVRPSHEAALQLLYRTKTLIGFQSGLTPLQFANNLTCLGICGEPSVENMGFWISKHRNLGAFAGLHALGFNVVEKEGPAWVQAAFKCVYGHLDKHLTTQQKQELHFGVIFVEHILCKVVPW
ncbi:hypothetical protein FA95DRAFT_1476325, partial [Auriscalpium vulgare]